MTVVDVLPNGNLLVSGEKQIAFNKGAEYVRFSGVVNPQTITAANTVSSTQVAEARFEYRSTSRVDLAEANSLLTRFFYEFSSFLGIFIMRKLMKNVVASALICGVSLPIFLSSAHAERLKDIAGIQGVRQNQLMGYGLVVGLDGSGDQTTQTPFHCTKHY